MLRFIDDCEGFMATRNQLGSELPASVPLRDSKSSNSSTKGRRPTPAQEIQLLRQQEYELSRKMEMLHLDARAQALRVGRSNPQCMASLTFWGQAASRQYHYRIESEQENRRLRELMTLQTSRAKKLEQLWLRQLNTALGGRTTSCAAIPVETNAVLIELMAEVESLYAGIDEFLDIQRRQQRYEPPFHEFTDAQNVPFGRSVVDRAIWEALALRTHHRSTPFTFDVSGLLYLSNFNLSRQRWGFIIAVVCFLSWLQQVDATNDGVRGCLHRDCRFPKINVRLQIRVATRKFREANRTVFVSRKLMEPLYLQGLTSLGITFWETEVRVVTSNQPPGTNSGESDAGVATIETYMRVTRHIDRGRGVPLWKSWGDGRVARSVWEKSIAKRRAAFEDLLFEEARHMQQ
ncbi:hypothetical protein BBJ28_00013138 [Nothophytophthora sp. Chile5]|nr:hypothetical protein BBJ28_00013138 [Nothophytophthora sp. Chile5]